MTTNSDVRTGAWRSRWAAVGAAVAVTLGAGGLLAVDAASSEPSSYVAIDPTRILDTRTDVGLAGPFVSGVGQKLQVTGSVPTQPPGGAAAIDQEVVPETATSAVFNVTVVGPQTKGFLSIRPGDADGLPATSNINFGPGGPNIANAVTVQLPANGEVDIFVNGTVGHVLVDVAGYHLPATGSDPGPVGPPGPAGPPGDDGAPGPAFIPGYEIVQGPPNSFTGTVTLEADCPAGKIALGGGGNEIDDFSTWSMEDSRPKADGTGWQVKYVPEGGGPASGAGGAWAVCATAAP